MKHLIAFLLAFIPALLTALPAAADDQAPDIVAHIIEADTTTVIQLPDGLDDRLRYTEPVKEPVKAHNGMAGYRIQVFSDNNVRTAKNEARKKEMTVAARFPQYRTYRIYSAPYWRVRVGDFRTNADAEAAAQALRSAFPAFSREIRVVKDRINVVD